MSINLPRLLERFRKKHDFQEQVEAYRTVFHGAHALHVVLPDLAEFCGAYTPMPDGIERQARAAGRLDVWLHIKGYLTLTDKQIVAVMHGIPSSLPQEGIDG